MRSLAITTCVVSFVALLGASAAQADGIDPFYTGSLLSPSPAAPKAGLLAFEPYVFGTINNYSYNKSGHVVSKADPASELQTLTLIKYGITDNLSIQVIPTTSETFDSANFDSGSQRGDTSAELEYLVTRGDPKTGAPKISASAGFNLPTGRYDHLDTAADGDGAGTYRARFGLLAQSLLFGESQHPVRIRVYGQGFIPISGTGVNGFSTFGTDANFKGYGSSGTSFDVGASVEYSFTQRLVFAFDAYYGYSASSNVVGFETNGTFFGSHGGHSDSTQLAPAFEYSWNDYFGIIVGVNFTVEGTNTSTIVQPQIAFNYVFDTNKPDFGFADILKGVIPQ